MEPPGLTVSLRRTPHETIVVAVGEVDLATVGVLEEAIEAAASVDRPVVVDLDGVTFLDSSGIAAFAGCWREGRDLTLRNAHGVVRRTLQISGLIEFVEPDP